MSEGKTLYWVKFIDQSDGRTIDTYFLANSLAHLEENIADILEVKAINDVEDLTAPTVIKEDKEAETEL